MLTLNDILSNPETNFSTFQISLACRVSEQTVRSWINQGSLRYEKVAGRFIIRGKWLRDYLQKCGDKNGFKHISEILSSKRFE